VLKARLGQDGGPAPLRHLRLEREKDLCHAPPKSAQLVGLPASSARA
jgi:hypothetical protein